MPVPRELPIPLYLFACLLLGGASNGGFWANWLLQLLGALLLGWAFWTRAEPKVGPSRRKLSTLMLVAVLLVVLQFVPIPVAMWNMAPGRVQLADEAALAGITYAPLFWGLLPHEALKSALWALPALALGLAMLRLPHWKPVHLAWAVIAAMVLSVVVGAVQLAQGGASPAYFYSITNRGLTVGFFANANHLSTLLLASIPFIAALIERSRTVRGWGGGAFLGVAFGLLIVALAGIAVNGSRMGLALVVPVLAASALICFATPAARKASVIGFPLALAMALVWLFSSTRGADFLALEGAASTGNRMYIWGRTWDAAKDFLPLGSGLGTFAEVIPRYENPDSVVNFFLNHAHNDYLELFLEFGLVVVPVLLAFFLWWGARARRIWLAKVADPFARAAVVSSAIMLVHSLADYPLRTAGLSSLFVASLAMMTMWLAGDGYSRVNGAVARSPRPDAGR